MANGRDRRADAADGWWLKMLGAMAALFFGVAAVFWPDLQMSTLVYLFSAFVLALGLLDLIGGLMRVGARSDWWLLTLFGAGALGVGLYLVRNPDVAFDTFVLLTGFTLVARGIFELMGSYLTRDDEDDRSVTLMTVAALAAVAAGGVVLFQKEADGVSMVWVLGLYALIAGAVNTVLALAMHDRRV